MLLSTEKAQKFTMSDGKKSLHKAVIVFFKKPFIAVSFLFLGLLSHSIYAGTGLLFQVIATGAPNNATITLCLNGKGALSCQEISVAALNLRISTIAPGHVYPFAGIKINTPGYTLANLGNDCMMHKNGFCLFRVSSSTPQSVTLLPPIGAAYAGGIVACLEGAPYMNLIAATSDSINGIPWGAFANSTGAGSNIDGKSNSTAIINAGVTNSAVNLCTGTINGYNDWFLPAKEQLNCLYTHQSAITSFMNAIYWSSTEDSDTNAWFQFFDNGNQLSAFKTLYNSVRCVRALS